MASETALAAAMPVSRAPTRPGPTVTATFVEVAEPDAGRLKRLLHQRVEGLDVRARRDLGHHAAEPFVQVHLGRDEVRSDGEAVLHHRDGGLVAGGFDPQGDHASRPDPGAGPERAPPGASSRAR